MLLVSSSLKIKIVNSHFLVRRLYNCFSAIRRKILIPNLPRKIPSFDTIIFQYLERNEDVVFVQIGANDGEFNHTFFYSVLERALISVLVEPVPNLFHDLKLRFQIKDNVCFENSAISDSVATLNFYSIDYSGKNELPGWAKGLGSFEKDTILKHVSAIKDLESHILEVKVPVITYQKLQEKYGLRHVGILQIDTEGFDWKIIDSIDLDQDKPDILIFEHKHLSFEDYNSCLKKLSSHYRSIYENSEGDTVCF